MPASCRARTGAAPPPLRLAEVLQAALPRYLQREVLLPRQWKVLRAIGACRTPALGAHAYRCLDCGRDHIVLHSCRNRHCPRCQGGLALAWLEKQRQALLPIPYFHLVFTLPHGLNPLLRQNRAPLYNLLFEAASQTLLEFGRRRFQGQIGATAVLHTWSQNLGDHYHLHCIVTGGALRLGEAGWKAASPHYLFPVRALSKVFRGKFRAGLEALHREGKLEFHGQLEGLARPTAFKRLLRQLPRQWVVYAKRPFAGPIQVLEYLSLYTHRVALSERRLLELDRARGTVAFSYKDYADGSRRKTMQLELAEFLRRFLLHILPERFVKIRHFGLLGNHGRQARLERVREQLQAASRATGPERAGPGPVASRNAILAALAVLSRGREPLAGGPACPFCGSARLKTVRVITPPRLDSS